MLPRKYVIGCVRMLTFDEKYNFAGEWEGKRCVVLNQPRIEIFNSEYRDITVSTDI